MPPARAAEPLRFAMLWPPGDPLLESPGGTSLLWPTKRAEAFPEADCVIVATGLAPDSAAAEAVRKHAAAGKPTLGLGPGFASLCAIGLLPGQVQPVALPLIPQVCVRVEGQPTPFTAGIPAGRVLHLPMAYAAAYHSPDRLVLEQAGQVVFRYCDEWAGLGDAQNPYAAAAGIAGVCSPEGHVVGLQGWLPSPASGAQAPSHHEASTQIFASLALWVAQRKTRKASR